MAYNLLYYAEFDSRGGTPVRLEISGRNSTLSATKVALGSSPTLTMDRDDRIQALSLSFDLETTDSDNYIALITPDQTQYKVVLKINSSIIFSGFLATDSYKIADVAPPSDVSFVAHCGLKSLRNYDFLPWDGALTGIIKRCFDEADTNFFDGRTLSVISSLCDSVETDPKTFFECVHSSFYEKDGQTIRKYLDSFLESINADLIQNGPNWTLSRISDLEVIEDANGKYVEDYDRNRYDLSEITGMNDGQFWPVGHLDMEVVMPSGGVKVIAQNVFRSMIIDNVAYSGGAALIGGFHVIPAGASAVFTFSLPSDSDTQYLGDNLMLSFRGKVTDATILDEAETSNPITVTVKHVSGTSTHYLSQQFSDTSQEVNQSEYDDDDCLYLESRTIKCSGTGYWKQAGAKTFQLQYYEDPEKFDDIAFYLPVKIDATNYATGTITVTIENSGDNEIKLDFYGRVDVLNQKEGNSITVRNGNSYELSEDVECIIQNSYKMQNQCRFNAFDRVYENSSQGTNMFASRRVGDSSDFERCYPMPTLIAMEMALTSALPRQRLSGTINFPQSMIGVPLFWSYKGIYYIIEKYTLNTYEDELNFEMISIPNALITNTLTNRTSIAQSRDRRERDAMQKQIDELKTLFR